MLNSQEPVMVLCVDPSITHWGYSVFVSGSWELTEFKTINYSSKLSKEERWWKVVQVMDELTERHNVKLILTEFQFGSKFDNSLLQTVAMCGMIAGKRGVEVRYLSPASWKKWGLGNAKVSKTDTILKVSETYPNLYDQTEHVADSVGLMLAFINNPEIGLKKKKP